MTTSKNTSTETYTIEHQLSEGMWFAQFAITAKNEADALYKALDWALYHSFYRGDIRVRLATENEKTNWLHNEWVR